MFGQSLVDPSRMFGASVLYTQRPLPMFDAAYDADVLEMVVPSTVSASVSI
jgi:hypothetical protein